MPKEFRGENVRYVLAAGFVAHEYLGKILLGPGGPQFLDYRTLADGSAWYGHSARLILVGSTIFVLRSSSGFSELCRRLKGRDFRSTFFELLAARLFLRGGFDIKARPEGGALGKDFDFSAVKGGTTINVEVTGLKPLKFSPGTLKNALKQKRKQLPTDAPGVICCVHPEDWFKSEADLSVELRRAAMRLFSTSQRVNAVVFLSEIHLDPAGHGREGGILATKEVYINPVPRLPAPIDFLLREPLASVYRRQGRKWSGSSQALKAAARDTEFHRWVDQLLS
ncbi:MAG TPA: hypothetical protein VGA77_04965 [Propylenella sp.]